MNSLNALNSRQLSPSLFAPAPATSNATMLNNNNAARKSGDEKVSLSDYGQRRAQGETSLDGRVAGLGNATIDLAQGFLSSFASQLLGDQAKGATFSFDDVSLEASSQFSAATQYASGANGSQAAAGFRLEDASSFSGRGKITTADGKTFSFELEVRYSSVQQGLAASSTSAPPPSQSTTASDDKADRGKRNPQDSFVNFAGTAADLFKRLSSDDVRTPFTLSIPDIDGSKNSSKSILGDLLLRLTDLQGGPRSLDLRNTGNDNASTNKVNVLA